MNETEAAATKPAENRSMKSAVDVWIAAVLLGSALVCLWAAFYSILVGGLVGWIIGVPTLLIGTVMPLWMLLGTVYRLEAEQIVARSGPFRWRVAYRDIRSITRRRELMAGPALSMDRLVIDYGPMRWLIISPRDPEAFQHALEQRLNRTG